MEERSIPCTYLKTEIIVGSGSATFEIIRDLVELPLFMIVPKWLDTKCKLIAIRNFLEYLSGVLLNRRLLDRPMRLVGRKFYPLRRCFTNLPKCGD